MTETRSGPSFYGLLARPVQRERLRAAHPLPWTSVAACGLTVTGLNQLAVLGRTVH